MNAEAYFLRLERRTTVLFLLLLVEAVVMFVCWAVTPAPAEPPVLPTKAVPATVLPAKLGSKGNPIDCLYVNKLLVIDDNDDNGKTGLMLWVNPEAPIAEIVFYNRTTPGDLNTIHFTSRQAEAIGSAEQMQAARLLHCETCESLNITGKRLTLIEKRLRNAGIPYVTK